MSSHERTARTAWLVLSSTLALVCGLTVAAQTPAQAPVAPSTAVGGGAPGGGAAAPGAAPARRGGGFVAPEPADYNDHTGWTQIFDGKTLTGWDGNPQVWRVENGAIVAENTAERRVGSTFLIWQGGEPADFEWKLEIKADPEIHSGVFYRSKVGPTAQRAGGARQGGAAGAAAPGAAGTARGAGAAGATAGQAAPARAAQPPPAIPSDPRWNVNGYALDFDYDRGNDGNVEDVGGGRTDTEIAWRGGIVRTENGKRPRYLGSLGDRDELMNLIKLGEWNELHIIARGNTLTHIINGHVMAILVDDDAVAAKAKGVLALQIESFGTGKISFRNIWLKQY